MGFCKTQTLGICTSWLSHCCSVIFITHHDCKKSIGDQYCIFLLVPTKYPPHEEKVWESTPKIHTGDVPIVLAHMLGAQRREIKEGREAWDAVNKLPACYSDENADGTVPTILAQGPPVLPDSGLQLLLHADLLYQGGSLDDVRENLIDIDSTN